MRDTVAGMFNTLKRYAWVSLYALFDVRNFPKVLRATEPVTINMKGLFLTLRPGIWDYATAWETIVEQSYKPRIGDLPKRPAVAVDLGSYLGDFAVWAVRQLHVKKVVTVDADPVNYSFIPPNIKLNRMNRNITPTLRALFSISGKKVGIKAPSEKIHAIRAIDTRPRTKGTTTVTLKDLMGQHKLTTIDYLKVDIEGAEEYLFTRQNENLFKKKVRFVALEAHPKCRLSPYYYVNYLKSLDFTVTYRPYLRWTPREGKTITLEIQAWNTNF